MIVRIVKMHFRQAEIENFKELFMDIKMMIRGFEGISHLECLQDLNNPQIFFTYSHWDSEAALEEYRNSELFETTWSKTKQMFADKPQAWSTETFFRSE